MGTQNNTRKKHLLTLLVCTNQQLNRLQFSGRTGCHPRDTPCVVATNFTDTIDVFVSLFFHTKPEDDADNCPPLPSSTPRRVDVLRYDSYNVLVANCAPAHRRVPFNLTANTTYRNANGFLACGQQPFPAMYNVFTACWGLVALTLLVRLVRDSDSSVQREYATKNVLVAVVLSIPLLFSVHGQTASAGYKLSDKVGLLDPPPFWWLRPVLYVARETAMYGTVLVLATGWRVAPREHCKDHVFTICLLPFKQPTPAYDRHQHTLCNRRFGC